MYTKVKCYQKIGVLVFSFMYLVLVDTMDRSNLNEKQIDTKKYGGNNTNNEISM